MSSDDRARRVERQLATAQQITHLGSWEWDVSTNAVTWSDELYRIYGFEPQSRPITFEFFMSRLLPADRARVQREVGLALERGTRFAYPERIVRQDGSVRRLDTIGEPARDAEGRVVGLIGTCRDVTDDLARDELIRLYADIVSNMQIGVAVLDVTDPATPETFRLVTINPAAERAARRPLGDVAGKTLQEVIPHAIGGPLPELVAAVARDGKVREIVQDRGRDPAFPERALALKAFPLPGNRVGLAIDDITASAKVHRLQAAEHHTLERAAAGHPLPAVLCTLVAAIEEYLPHSVATLDLFDMDGSSQRTILSNEKTDAPRPDVAGLTHLSVPVVATDGRALGTFDLYRHGRRELSPEETQALDRAAHLSSLAIERAQMEEQLRELTAHLESVREDERTGIAREIHDQLGQALTALKMDLAWLARRIGGESSVTGVTLLEKIAAMSEMTDGIIDQVRRISAELRPGVLDDLGLLAALEWQGLEFEKRTGTSVFIGSNVGDEPLDRGLSTAVFRIFQEALTNVARHAQATHVDVRLDRKDGVLSLEVKDDGCGITPEAANNPRSLGLLGMRERARRLGGAVRVHPAEGGGTSVSVEVPIWGRAAS